MSSEGDDTLLLDTRLGLSSTVTNTGDKALLYRNQVGRGGSNVSTGDRVALSTSQKAQGKSVGDVYLRNFRVNDRAPTTGQQVTLSVDAVNTRLTPVDYDVKWIKNGLTVATQTLTIPSNGVRQYELTQTSDTPACNAYEANSAGPLEVCWSPLSPGQFTATPGTVYLAADEDTTTLSLTVSNPSSQDIDTAVSFVEDGGSIYYNEVSIPAGLSHTFEHDVTYLTPQDHTYRAKITDQSISGITQTTNPEPVTWTDKEVVLGDLTADDTALFKSDSTTLRIPVINITNSDKDYTVTFTDVLRSEQVATVTKTIPSNAQREYTTTVSKSSVGCLTYRANTSNTVEICWSNLRPGDLTATPEDVNLESGATDSTLSIDVQNPSEQDISTKVIITEDGTPIFSDTTTIPSNDSVSFSTTVSKDVPGFFTYQATVRDNSVGITSEVTPITVSWTNEDNQFAELISEAPVANGENTDEGVTWEIAPGGSEPQARIVTANDERLYVKIEDLSLTTGDRDFNDVYLLYDQLYWNRFGQIRVQVSAGEAGDSHSWNISGATFSYDSSNLSSGDVIFNAFYRDDGNIYDADTGDKIGEWNYP